MSVDPEWRVFQKDVAAVFVMAGLPVAVDAALTGARARHDVDVVVRLGEDGDKHRLWLVECKLWGRPVPKAEVLTLLSVVEDVGAERGFLISASGFQPAAILASKNTNLTLCDLDALRAELRTRRIAHGLVDLELRVDAAAARLDELYVRTVWPPSHGYGELFTLLNYKQWDHWRTSLSTTRAGLSDARMARWPCAAAAAPPRRELSSGERLMVSDVEEFLASASQRLEDAVCWIGAAERWLALAWDEEERSEVEPLARLLVAPFLVAIQHAKDPKRRSGPTFMEQELISRLRDQPVQALGYLPSEVDGITVNRIGNRDDLFLRGEDGQAVVIIGASWGGTKRERTCFAYRLMLVDAIDRIGGDLDRGLRSLGRLITLAMFIDSDGVERGARLDFDSGTSVSVWVTESGYVEHRVGDFPGAVGLLSPGRTM